MRVRGFHRIHLYETQSHDLTNFLKFFILNSKHLDPGLLDFSYQIITILFDKYTSMEPVMKPLFFYKSKHTNILEIAVFDAC